METCTCYTYGNCKNWTFGISIRPCGWCTDCKRADEAKASCPEHAHGFRYDSPEPLVLVQKAA